ncbi:M4 family metallopeptidase [Streptomyces sp. NPDC048057]|uniref:M4 family metallopeptidase n=1 Tax=Streptomyces sp. NPDC048057 TaxID=3155628 RepID=UPI0033C50517
MTPLPRRASAATALLTGIALFAVVLPPATAGAAPSATDAPAASAASPRAGALPVRISPAEQAKLLADATAARAATGSALGLGAKEQLVPRSVLKDADGTLHTRYERTYDGLPVLGGDLVVHTAPSGRMKGATKATEARIAVPGTSPARTAASARAFSLGRAKAVGTKGAALGQAPRKVLWAPAGGRPVLAWETVVKGTQPDGMPSELHVVTDATTGVELHRREAVVNAAGTSADTREAGSARQPAKAKPAEAKEAEAKGARTDALGTGRTRYSGDVQLGTSRYGSLYNMTDSARGGHRTYDLLNGSGGYGYGGRLVTGTDNVWGDGTSANRQTDAADAAYGAQVTWDYFAEVHQRYGVRNDGDGGSSKVHDSVHGRGAYWWDSCFCVIYGPGGTTPYTSIDMAANALGTGLINNTTKFYSGESAGLWGATMDIFAAAVEFHADNSRDPGDYLTGENVDIGGLNARHRQMDRPSKNIRGTDYWHPRISSSGNGYYVGGPAMHWFYLLSEGSGAKTVNGVAYDSPTHDGQPVTPIGRSAVERIWYRALTVYMTSRTDYAGARAATLAAAADLYGASSSTHHRVADAWGAVNVGTRPGGSPRPVGPTFENTTDYPIPAGPAVAESPITVTGVPGKASNILVVDVNVAAAYVLMELVAPDGSTYPLVNNLALENGPTISSTGVDASSETANGTWKLRVRGEETNPWRYIDSWKLNFL